MQVLEKLIAILGMLSAILFGAMFKYGNRRDSLWFLSFSIACFVLIAILKKASNPNKRSRGKHFKH